MKRWHIWKFSTKPAYSSGRLSRGLPLHSQPNFSSQRFPDLIPCFYSLALTPSFPCDRRFAQGLESPNARMLPDSLSPVGDFPTLFHPFTTICSIHLKFSLFYDMNYFLFSLLNSCFSIILFTLLCFSFCRRQNLAPDAMRSSGSKVEIRLGVCTWTGIDTHEGGEKTRDENWLWQGIHSFINYWS